MMLKRLIFTIAIVALLSPTVSAGRMDEPKPAVRTPPEPELNERPQLQSTQTWLPLVQTPKSAPPQNLEELITPSFDYDTWYETETGYTGNPEFFGAYALTPVGDTLYLGFGTARPAEDGNDGALFASSDAISVNAISPLDEQGFIDMTPHDGVIYIPGADPTDQGPEHQWDWGNTYVYPPPASIIKNRNLPNVIHTWGLWHHPTQNRLYAAVSSHFGDYKAFTGEVFVSQNDGENWTLLANLDDGIGDYRTYDITGFNGKLYATWNDVYMEPCGIAESDDDGATWTRLADFTSQTACRPRLFVYANRLMALSFDRTELLALNKFGVVTRYTFPDFGVKDWAYNYLAKDSNGRLYTITEDGRVVRTSDLSTWETIVSSDHAFITIAYWPEKDWIVLADRGRDYANVWKIDLTVTALTLPATPHLSAARNGEAIQLAWDTVSGAVNYRVYRSTSPYFTSHLSNLWDESTQPAIQIPITSDENHFYLVRSKDASGNLSLQSNRTGVFQFALAPG